MTVIDWIIIAIIVISALISVKRGFVKEALSLVSWIAALVLARLFSGNLATLMSDLIESPNWRLALAFAILFAATLVVGAMVNHLLSEVIRMTGLTGTDRFLGVVFGVLRGLIIVVAILALMRLFALEQLWPDAVLVDLFDPVIKWTGDYVHKASEALIKIGQEN